MPIYEYKCQKCGYQFEQLQKINDKPLTVCPNCHGRKLKKLVSAAYFHLKGSGWYKTDYKKEPLNSENKAEVPKGSAKKDKQEEKNTVKKPMNKNKKEK
jgi:putative FmdB family regulatory protein